MQIFVQRTLQIGGKGELVRIEAVATYDGNVYAVVRMYKERPTAKDKRNMLAVAHALATSICGIHADAIRKGAASGRNVSMPHPEVLNPKRDASELSKLHAVSAVKMPSRNGSQDAVVAKAIEAFELSDIGL